MNTLLKNIFEIIQDVTLKNKNSLKYGCLSSITTNTPNQRMVVLRAFSNNEIIIYTDSRSKKVNDFIENPVASLLLFDNENMEQIILKGKITVKRDNNDNIWQNVPEFAHRDYTSKLSPGTPIDTKYAEYTKNQHYFCVLKFSFFEIDYLKINQPYNSRAIFKLNEANNWEGSYIVP